MLRSDHLAGQLAAFGVEDVFDDPIGGDGGGVRDVVSFTGFGGQLAICQLHRIMVSEGRRQGGGVGCNWCFGNGRR